MDEPARADILFPWEEMHAEGMWGRAEPRRQQWQRKRKELELVAARNFVKMKVDVVGPYRFRGFGDDLFGGDAPNRNASSDLIRGNLHTRQSSYAAIFIRGNLHTRQSSYATIFIRDNLHTRQSPRRTHRRRTDNAGGQSNGPYGEWAIRQADTRNWRLNATAISMKNNNGEWVMMPVKPTVSLTAAINGLAHRAIEATPRSGSGERFLRNGRRGQRTQDPRGLDPNGLEILLGNVLTSQSRAVQASTSYHRALVDYNQALMNIHLAEGTLLDYHQVFLSEGPHSPQALRSARQSSSRLVP